MKKEIAKHVAFVLAIFIIYILAINIASSFFSLNFQIGSRFDAAEIKQDNTIEEAKLTDDVSIQVSRKRWYGKIYELLGSEGKTSNLYLLGFIKLPLVNEGSSYIIYHVLFLIAILIYISAVTTVKLINYKKYRYYYM